MFFQAPIMGRDGWEIPGTSALPLRVKLAQLIRGRRPERLTLGERRSRAKAAEEIAKAAAAVGISTETAGERLVAHVISEDRMYPTGVILGDDLKRRGPRPDGPKPPPRPKVADPCRPLTVTVPRGLRGDVVAAASRAGKSVSKWACEAFAEKLGASK